MSVKVEALPNASLYRSLAKGHVMRSGHALDARLVSTDDGASWHVVRLCCGEALPVDEDAPTRNVYVRVYANSVVGKVVRTERVGTSGMGNPSWRVGIETPSGDSLIVLTSSNISLSYAITNPEYRDNVHEFELTRAGRLSGRVTAVAS